jgi:hypothetical protein
MSHVIALNVCVQVNRLYPGDTDAITKRVNLHESRSVR